MFKSFLQSPVVQSVLQRGAIVAEQARPYVDLAKSRADRVIGAVQEGDLEKAGEYIRDDADVAKAFAKIAGAQLYQAGVQKFADSPLKENLAEVHYNILSRLDRVQGDLRDLRYDIEDFIEDLTYDIEDLTDESITRLKNTPVFNILILSQTRLPDEVRLASLKRLRVYFLDGRLDSETYFQALHHLIVSDPVEHIRKEALDDLLQVSIGEHKNVFHYLHSLLSRHEKLFHLEISQDVMVNIVWQYNDGEFAALPDNVFKSFMLMLLDRIYSSDDIGLIYVFYASIIKNPKALGDAELNQEALEVLDAKIKQYADDAAHPFLRECRREFADLISAS